MMKWKASFMSQIRKCHNTLVNTSDNAVHQAMLSTTAFCGEGVTKLPSTSSSIRPFLPFASIQQSQPPTLASSVTELISILLADSNC